MSENKFSATKFDNKSRKNKKASVRTTNFHNLPIGIKPEIALTGSKTRTGNSRILEK